MKRLFKWGITTVAILFFSACLFLTSNIAEAQNNNLNGVENDSISIDYLPSIDNSLGLVPEINNDIYATNIYNKLINSYKDYMYDYRDNHASISLPSSYCLRDDYLLYASMQNPNGLCWAYAGAESLATTIMMQTNEYLDPSEAWVSLICALAGQEGAYNLEGYLDGFDILVDSLGLTSLSNDSIKSQIKSLFSSYLVGDGGNFIYFDMILRAFGLVNETDFDYSMFNFAGKTSDGIGNLDDYYNFYSQFAIKEIINDVKAIKFGTDKDTLNGLTSESRQALLNSVKYHIKNRGSVYCGLNWKDVSTVTASISGGSKQINALNFQGTSAGGHAVSIIGWDDNISIIGNDNNVHTGAWIVLNSWGDYWGDDGIFYIFYDCTDYNDCFRGYVYEKDESDTLYLNISTDSSEAKNGYVSTDKYGAYYGNFSGSNHATKQRNLIYSNNLDISYNYNLSSNATIDNILINKGTEDRTDQFAISIDSGGKTIRISGNNLKLGTYKLVIRYHVDNNSSITLENINCFSLLDKIETGFVLVELRNNSNETIVGDRVVSNMGKYFLYNNYTSGLEEIIIPVKENFTNLKVNVTYFSSSYGERFGYGNDYKSYTYYSAGNYTSLTKSNSLGSRTYKLIVNTLQNGEKLVDVVYDTNGGINNENNKSRMVCKTDGSARIYAPTLDGYTFCGWYLDPDFNNSLEKDVNGDYIFNQSAFKSLNVINSNTDDENNADYSYYKEANTAFLYAKWEKNEDRAEVSFYTDGEEQTLLHQSVLKGEVVNKPNNPTKLGYEFKFWSTSSSQEIEYNFSNSVTQDLNLYAVFKLKTPSDVKIYLGSSQYSNSSLVSLVEYTFNARFSHDIKDRLSISYTWEINDFSIGFNSSCNRRFMPGTYTMKLIVRVCDGSQTTESSTVRTISVTNFPTNSVTISRNGINSASQGDGVKYDVKIYKLKYGYEPTTDSSLDGYELVVEIDELDNLNLDFSNYTEESGSYKLLVDKYTNLYIVENAIIETFDVVVLYYDGIFDGIEKTVYIEKGTNVIPLDSASTNAFIPIVAGHDLLSWCLDEELNNSVSSLNITEDTTLYAKWAISAFLTKASADGQIFASVNYDPSGSVEIVAEVIDAKEGLTCSYGWYKVGDNRVKSTSNKINIKNCADSGQYYCRIILSDCLGLIRSSVTNSVEVYIVPAKITIKAKDVTATWLLGGKTLEYEIVSDFTGNKDDLNIKLTSDADITKTGTYAIHVSIDNSNYELIEIAGTYEVRATTFIFAGVSVGVLGLAIILIVRKVKQRY